MTLSFDSVIVFLSYQKLLIELQTKFLRYRWLEKKSFDKIEGLDKCKGGNMIELECTRFRHVFSAEGIY